jgi:hypothetical protein
MAAAAATIINFLIVISFASSLLTRSRAGESLHPFQAFLLPREAHTHAFSMACLRR